MITQVEEIFYGDRGAITRCARNGEEPYLNEEEETALEAFIVYICEKARKHAVSFEDMKMFLDLFYTFTRYDELETYAEKMYSAFYQMG